MKKIIKICKSNKGVSEVLGTVLLLGIAVAIFSTLYLIVLSEPFDASEPYPTIVAYVEGQNLIIEHRGGDELGINTRFSLTIGGKSIPIILKEDLDDINSDEKWNFGERIIKDINGSFSLTNYTAGVFGVDETNNRAIFSGDLNIFPENDIGVEIKVDNEKPGIGDYINITIIVYNYRGDVNATGVKINFVIPEGLLYQGHTPGYNYVNETGIWDIEDIPIRGSISLTIKAKVVGMGEAYEPTQIIMVLDGSGSIDSSDWTLMTNGLANAVTDIFPKDDENVELTVIQFGDPSYPFSYPPHATFSSILGGHWEWVWVGPGFFDYERVWVLDEEKECGIEPIIVTETNNDSINQTIRNLHQMGGATPMSCGLRLGADTAFNSINYSADKRQVVIMVTDGIPNCVWDGEGYNGTYVNNAQGKLDAEDAAGYLIDHLQMNGDKDQFNALAVGDEPEIDWLKNETVWPQPGTVAPPYGDPGWVTKIDGYSQFETAIKQIFRLIFENIRNEVTLFDLNQHDPNADNDKDVITITPQ